AEPTLFARPSSSVSLPSPTLDALTPQNQEHFYGPAASTTRNRNNADPTLVSTSYGLRASGTTPQFHPGTHARSRIELVPSHRNINFPPAWPRSRLGRRSRGGPK